MERSEPNLVPEWYRGTGSSATTTGSFGPHTWSSHSDRNTSSFHVSSSSNGSTGQAKDLPLQVYNRSFRSYHDRNWNRVEVDLCDRERPLSEDGLSNYTESLITTKSARGSLRYSHSMASGRLGDSWIKRSGHDLSNGIPPKGSIITGISKSSFERDFPSLGVEEKNAASDLAGIASSPSLATVIHNLPFTASTIISGEGWTSALAEAPHIIGGNCPVISSILPTNPTSSIVANNSTNLNMAETIAQSPTRVRPMPQISNDSQKIEELHRLQILKLRPVTPLVPKNSGFNPAEKSKTKVSRMVEFSPSRSGQQSSSHLLVHGTRPSCQPGHFQVLNRERNSPSPTGIGIRKLASGVQATPKGLLNSKLTVDGKSGSLSPISYADKKFPSQAQNRNDFFNSLRKKASAVNDDSIDDASSFNLEKVDRKFVVEPASSAKKENVENYSSRGCDTFEEPEKFDPDEEEASFLRSLGWEENAGVEALTSEEIESFLSVYKSRRPASG